MRTAVSWLFDVKAPFVRTSPTQLKVGRINFYPDKGTIYFEGDRAPLPQRGLHPFQELLRTREGLGAGGIIRDPKPRPAKTAPLQVPRRTLQAIVPNLPSSSGPAPIIPDPTDRNRSVLGVLRWPAPLIGLIGANHRDLV